MIRPACHTREKNLFIRGALHFSDLAYHLYEPLSNCFVKTSSLTVCSLVPSQVPGNQNIRPPQEPYRCKGVSEKDAYNTRGSKTIGRRYIDPQTNHAFQVFFKSSVNGVKKCLQRHKILLAPMLYGSSPCMAREFMQVQSVLRSWVCINDSHSTL